MKGPHFQICFSGGAYFPNFTFRLIYIISEYGFIFSYNRSQHYTYLSGFVSGNIWFLSQKSQLLFIFLVLLYLILREQTLIYQECVQCAIQQVFSSSQLETTQTTTIKIKKYLLHNATCYH